MKKEQKIKKGQIWVETVVYTVIGLAIIGIVLGITKPAIDKYKDEVVIEQTIDVLKSINGEIEDVKYYGLGNKRPFEFRIKKGTLTIDSPADRIIYALEESKLEYSEANETLQQGDIIIATKKKGRKFDITLTLVYDDLNISSNNKDEKKVFQSAANPYKIFIENKGTAGGKTEIGIQ